MPTKQRYSVLVIFSINVVYFRSIATDKSERAIDVLFLLPNGLFRIEQNVTSCRL